MTVLSTSPPIAPPPLPEPEPQPLGTDRFALRVMQIGAIAIVLASSTLRPFDLDRFFIPKELVLHLTALLAGAAMLRRFTRVALSRIDLLLGGFLALGVVSAIFATNPWLAFRALAISISGVVLFWSARSLRQVGLARPLLNALGFAVVLTAITALLQAWGLDLSLFSANRSPGGTLGNRNFIAHVAAFGFPLLILGCLGARRILGSFAGGIGVVLAICALVLTRSRAAWIAFAVVMLIITAAIVLFPLLRRSGRLWARLILVMVMAGAGVAAALLVPNTLHWRSENPYLDTMKRVAEYDEGSGHGRLIQYEHSLRMALSRPVLGVGPGNWAVVYPEHAARHDPSMNPSEPGMTFNPWPSSDWVAWISERGLLAVILLGLALLRLSMAGLGRLRHAEDSREALEATALVATIAGVVLAGAFDAVLLLALPTFLVWTTLGALHDVPRPTAAPPHRWIRGPVLALLLLVCLGGAALSTAQLTAMGIYVSRSDQKSLSIASRFDPSNYRLQMKLAGIGRWKQRCEHAKAAHRLYPSARAAERTARGCSD